jgi:hypothetical protein
MIGGFKIDTRPLFERSLHESRMETNIGYRLKQEMFARNNGLMDLSTGRMDETNHRFRRVPEIEAQERMNFHHSRHMERDRQTDFLASMPKPFEFEPLKPVVDELPKFEPILPRFEPLLPDRDFLAPRFGSSDLFDDRPFGMKKPWEMP